MRDYWNNVPDPDEEELAEACIAIIRKIEPLSYPEMHNLRISAELCDRGHFYNAMQVVCERAGEKVPAGLDIILEDPDFDVRVSFMKKVVAAVDPAPTPAR